MQYAYATIKIAVSQAEYGDERLCLSACPPVSISPEPLVGIFPNLLQLLHVAVARFFFGGVKVRYELPVLWMTSCFHTMARNGRRDNAYKVGQNRATDS